MYCEYYRCRLGGINCLEYDIDRFPTCTTKIGAHVCQNEAIWCTKEKVRPQPIERRHQVESGQQLGGSPRGYSSLRFRARRSLARPVRPWGGTVRLGGRRVVHRVFPVGFRRLGRLRPSRPLSTPLTRSPRLSARHLAPSGWSGGSVGPSMIWVTFVIACRACKVSRRSHWVRYLHVDCPNHSAGRAGLVLAC
jgi:hypothetical protein